MKAILLVNLGSPRDLKLSSIKEYLTEFLTDDNVIDLPKIIQKILVKNIIVPFRSKKTQEAYNSIWKKEEKDDTDVFDFDEEDEDLF